MKIKSFMTMMVAAAALAIGMSSCSSDDDEPEAPLAVQVVGSYTGEEILTVSDENFNANPTYVFVKNTDTSVDFTIPASDGGAMVLPSLPVKGIALTKNGNTITGRLASYTGTVTNDSGAEKSYTVSDVTAIFNDNMVVVTYTLKYGNMPFDFVGKFTGTRK